jgi:hypothetical protein
MTVREFDEIGARTAFEDQILAVLRDEFSRLDDVARAAARFQRIALETLKNQRLQDGFALDDAGDLTNVFDVGDLTAQTAALVDISVMARVTSMLGLGKFKDEIVLRLIDQKFGKKPETMVA